MAAIISGSTLSVLFYDHSSSLGNQEGLLTGKVIDHVRDTISDSQINNVHVETNIYVYGCTCQSRFDSFHDNRGNIKQIDKSVIGWYRYRHNSSHRMSLKEKSIHHSLLKNIPPDKQDNFIFVLCTSQKSENMSTCDFDFTFFKYNISDKKYQAIPVTVINLGDTTHTEYKSSRSCTVDYDSGTLGSLLSSFEHELLGGGKKTSEAAGVEKMADSLQTHLQCLTHGVMESDHEVHKLQLELEQLEMRLQRKREKKRSMKPLPPSPVSPDPPSTSRVITKDEVLAKSKRDQRRREETNSLYPNLSDLKVSSGGSRTRRLSEDNYMMDTKPSNLIDDKCYILDSPVETADEWISPESLSVGQSGDIAKNHIDDKHLDIPFADSEGYDLQTSNQTKVSSSTITATATKESSDPFAFVAGVMASSKCDMLKKKDKGFSNNDAKSTQQKESVRVTRSRNNLATEGKNSTNQSSAIQNQNKKRQQTSRLASREKQIMKSSEQNGHTGSDEDIFDEKEDNVDHVIDVSSSPVF